MTYSSGGLIAAADYNGFVGTATQSGTLNYVWSTGNGQYGYGQTAVSQVSGSGLVTATQWASMLNTLNSTLTHQSNSGSGISNPTAGSQINYLSTLSTNIATANTNHLNAYSRGTLTSQSQQTLTCTQASQGTAATFTATRTITFTSGDAARYFFNSGGQVGFVIGSSGATNGGGTSRGADLVTLCNTNFVSFTGMGATTSTGISGTGGTVNTNATTTGYYGLGTSGSPTTLAKITATGTYAGDYIQLQAYTNGAQGSNSDNGSVVTFVLTLYSATHSGSFNDTVSVTVLHNLTNTPPETTNLTNTWGTPTMA